MDGRGFEQTLLKEGKSKPDISQSKQGAGDDTQGPGALTPAKQLRGAIPGHGKHHENPDPPGNARQALFAQDKDKPTQEHRAVDGEVACAQPELMPQNEERMRRNLGTNSMQREEQRFGDDVKSKVGEDGNEQCDEYDQAEHTGQH